MQDSSIHCGYWVTRRNCGYAAIPVGPPQPAPFLGWKTRTFYTVSLTVDTKTGEVVAVWYHRHNISNLFDKLTHGFVKSATMYAGFYGFSGSNVKATGRVAEFLVAGRPAAWSSHAAGIGQFARSAPGLPVAPELSQPVEPDHRNVILGYPLAYVWNSGIDHASQQRVLKWAIGHSWGK